MPLNSCKGFTKGKCFLFDDKWKDHRALFFDGTTVNSLCLLNSLRNWLFSKLPGNDRYLSVRPGIAGLGFGDERVSERTPAPLMDWPLLCHGHQNSGPDLTPLDFFSWGSIKDAVYVLPIPKIWMKSRTALSKPLKRFVTLSMPEFISVSGRDCPFLWRTKRNTLKKNILWY